MIENFPVRIYFRTKNSTKCKEIHSNPIPPPTGGRFELSFEKNLSYFCRLLWENCRQKKFVKKLFLRQKCKKMAHKKSPWRGTDFEFNFGFPRPGGITENPPHWGEIYSSISPALRGYSP